MYASATTTGSRMGCPVEAWLRHALSSAYDATLTERLPDDLLRLAAACPERRK